MVRTWAPDAFFFWSICKLCDLLEIPHELNSPIRSDMYVCRILVSSENIYKENTTCTLYIRVSSVVRKSCMRNPFRKEKAMYACLFKLWCVILIHSDAELHKEKNTEDHIMKKYILKWVILQLKLYFKTLHIYHILHFLDKFKIFDHYIYIHVDTFIANIVHICLVL